ncbi:MAG: hypothetical protein JWN83_2052 [Chitinophagaceae bacterium]|nr:hypothetical protein [Chitinophagaceae bacterium]
MTIEEIRYKVFVVIASNSEYTAEEIEKMYDPPASDPTLETFISPAQKARLGRALKNKLSCINSSDLTNMLYITVKTLGQLIKQINIYCPTISPI